MPKLQSCRLNSVATIERTYPHTYIPTCKHPAELITITVLINTGNPIKDVYGQIKLTVLKKYSRNKKKNEFTNFDRN